MGMRSSKRRLATTDGKTYPLPWQERLRLGDEVVIRDQGVWRYAEIVKILVPSGRVVVRIKWYRPWWCRAAYHRTVEWAQVFLPKMPSALSSTPPRRSSAKPPDASGTASP
jgi:hypothetical protein